MSGHEHVNTTSLNSDNADTLASNLDTVDIMKSLNGEGHHGLLDFDAVKRLPTGVVPTKLIGEGAANAVFELRFPDGSPVASQFQGMPHHSMHWQ